MFYYSPVKARFFSYDVLATNERNVFKKRGHQHSKLNPKNLTTGHSLKGAKSSIVNLLKNHFGDNWREDKNLKFFKENLEKLKQ